MNEVKGIVLLLGLVLLCYLTGVLLCRKDKEAALGSKTAYGCMGLFCLFELICLPLILLKIKFHVLFYVVCAVAGVLAVAGILAGRKEILKDLKGFFGQKINWWYVPAVLMILFQILVAVRGVHMDADDAFYLGTSATTLETDTMYQVDPYTGEAYSQMPMRYVLAPFPVFLACLSKLTAMHPAILEIGRAHV